jgi:hypothetical protein
MNTDFSFDVTAQKYVAPDYKFEAGRCSEPLPKVSSSTLSAFERLPTELRQMVYEYLGYPISNRNIKWTSDWFTEEEILVWKQIFRYEFWRWDATPNCGGRLRYAWTIGILAHTIEPLHPSRPPEDRDVLSWGAARDDYDPVLVLVNKNIRADIISSVFGRMEVMFNFQLSDRAIHYSRLESSWTFENDRPEGFYRMFMRNEDFHYLTNVSIGELAGYTFSTNMPHTKGRISARTVLARQAMSIDYLAKHCLSIRTFRVTPNLGKFGTGYGRRRRGPKVVSARALEPIIRALGHLAVARETLEKIIITQQFKVGFPKTKDSTWWKEIEIVPSLDTVPVTEEYTIDLKDILWTLRESKVLDAKEEIYKLLPRMDESSTS